jgi:hypothetical protein
MIAPTIAFEVVTNHRQFNAVRSTNQIIKFRVWRRPGRTEFDADFFSTRWELAPAAWQQIKARYDLEREFPCRRGSCGGGKSCIILAVAPEREEAWRTFLSNLLSRPESWLTWDSNEGDFVPQPPTLERAA